MALESVCMRGIVLALESVPFACAIRDMAFALEKA